MIKRNLEPIGLADIPRADAEIKRTIRTLGAAKFNQDPLFDIGDSFRLSLCMSAIKRHGAIIEAAIMDAVDQNPRTRVFEAEIELPRRVDVQFIIYDDWLIALEIKRGSAHDSTKLRQFRADLRDIPPLLREAFPSFAEIRFHIVFVSGVPPLREGFTLDDLEEQYNLRTHDHVLTATQRYSMALKTVLRERGL